MANILEQLRSITVPEQVQELWERELAQFERLSDDAYMYKDADGLADYFRSLDRPDPKEFANGFEAYALLCPSFLTSLQSVAETIHLDPKDFVIEDEDGELEIEPWEDDFASAALRKFYELGVREGPSCSLAASIKWIIDGGYMSWGGALYLWDYSDEWQAVTACFDSEGEGRWLDVLLGFVRKGAPAVAVGDLVYHTFGKHYPRPDQLSWGGLSAADVDVIVSALGAQQPPSSQA
ncbi:MAG: hypothetical protein KatS3mg062_0463 [Tepidiforma sp.]|nr:MAG: hypothetical protein KatS3mg062_0463 [Tepidiforma sp.]